MVYESATVFPTPEGAQLTSPPPVSTYGFQKLAVRVLREGRVGAVPAAVHDRPAVQLRRHRRAAGASATRDVMSGNVKLALSHVVPDLVLKALKGQDPLHILGEGDQVRHYTYGGDLARGHPDGDGVAGRRQRGLQPLDRDLDDRARAGRDDLAQGPRADRAGAFRFVSDPPFEHDVQRRVPDVRKAREVLGFEATTTLETMLDEVIPWIRGELEAGRLDDRPRRDRIGDDDGDPELSIVLPVYNEGEAVEPVLRALSRGVATPHELVVVYDFDGDTTGPGGRAARAARFRACAACATTSGAASSTR